MILQEINYYEFDGQANSWSLKNLTIEKINLLVGKNATGKTRTMSVIARLGSMFLEVQPVAFGYDLTNIKCCQYPNLSTLGGQPMYLLNVTENDRQADLFMKKIAIFVEGQTELIFMQKLITEIIGNAKLAFSIRESL